MFFTFFLLFLLFFTGHPNEPTTLSVTLTITIHYHQLEAKGFRNPFRLVILPGSGDIVIADVGLNTADSLKVVPNPLEAAQQGATMGNYGWPCIEGNAWIPPDTNT